MFSNPFFKNSGASSPKNNMQSTQQRPSVQDIMNKYKYNPSERVSHVDEQILGSLNESSNFLNEQSRHDKMFLNPISPQFDLDPQPKKDAVARLTFGEENKKFESQKLQNQRLLNENDLFDDMSHLKDKVLNMLERYSVALKAPEQQNKRNSIKHQLELDANQVAQEYSQIVDKFNNPDLSAISIADSTIPEQQLTQMFNLVEEFLTKFKNISQVQQEKSQLLRSRINAGESQLHPQSNKAAESEKQFTFQSNQSSKHSSQAVKNKAQAQFAQSLTIGQSNLSSNPYQQTFSKTNGSQQQSPTKTTTYQSVTTTLPAYEQKSIPAQQPITQLDMTVYTQFPKMDDSFYDQKQISMQRINSKLQTLKQKLLQELQKENMPYTQKILGEMISSLQEIINTQDYQLVKTIIFRIEQGIQQLSNNKEGSINLYKYINKALLNSKMKTDLFTQRASMPVHAPPEQRNSSTTMSSLNNYQTPAKIENSNTKFTQKIDIDRNFEKKERDQRHLEEHNIYFDQRLSNVNKPDVLKPKQQYVNQVTSPNSGYESRGSVNYERKLEDHKPYSQDARLSYQLQFESRPSINLEQRYSSNDPKNIYFATEYQRKTEQSSFQESQKLNYERRSEIQRPSENALRLSDMQRPSEQTMKRLFFDAALTLKNKLPSNHPGRNIMVSDLYEDYVKVGGDMQKFIQQKFDCY
ncbi:unnamed protein product (macronuclear) [Paramecium tetraurelia]|uniref:Uncharacterized protein n=1 Tax=Paramecium tetraurelia TaxID=5888 RepID=A0DN01_PARTE|nr:uncharacterized protein GSPATT00018623001 [Paramecium tetraurelia]CAK84418.1 unnamed protein product [Paramecium tetraurelia]|eukprot:XP_001451815.1 hypothetical protein (macronuclear) [Paramecium tetraurelia strain d4-2]